MSSFGTDVERLRVQLLNVRDEYNLIRMMAKCSDRSGLPMKRTPGPSDVMGCLSAANKVREEGLATVVINANPFDSDDARKIQLAHKILCALSEGNLAEVSKELNIGKSALAELLAVTSERAGLVSNGQ